MSNPLQPGPWKSLPGPGGISIPFYIITFDENGICTSPATLDLLVEATAAATDVFLFSHGWNNDWQAATSAYDSFAAHYVQLRQARWDPPARAYAPVLVGVFWPSAILVWPDERAPDIAGGNDDVAAGRQARDEVAVLAAGMTADQATRFYQLSERDGLTESEGRELAALLAPLLAAGPDELGPVAAPSAEELMGVWSEVGRRLHGGDSAQAGGFIHDAAHGGAAPQAAGFFDWLKPRDIIRATTVLMMKDRAGRVGGAGVATMLRLIIGSSADSRVHMIGHSYGGKVVLSALANGEEPSRQVESVLLLQPAMSALCFAQTVPGAGEGGYRRALSRSRQPVMTTFTSNDFPLTKVFHWAARRPSDLGEALIAGLPIPPSLYAALGGYGPQGVDAQVEIVTAKLAPDRYDVRPAGKRLIAIQADAVISGHGDVQNDATAWALLSQVMGDQPWP